MSVAMSVGSTARQVASKSGKSASGRPSSSTMIWRFAFAALIASTNCRSAMTIRLPALPKRYSICSGDDEL
jgi:hypothetical protein